MRYVDPPFELGETLTGTDDDGNLINTAWEGAVFAHQDIDRTASKVRTGRGRLSGRQVIAVILRNVSGSAFLGKRLCQLEQDASNPRDYLGRADGYAAVLRQQGIAVIDPDLDSNGVANNDLFWGIVSGPTTILTGNAGTAFNGDIAVAAPIVAATAAGTTTTLAGRVSNITGTEDFTDAINLVGFALSARTTGETDSDLLINADIRGFR